MDQSNTTFICLNLKDLLILIILNTSTCKLKKSIYALKQSARCWNQTLDSFLIGNGYQKSGADNCIYVKSKTKADGFISFVLLAIYVDDIIPVSNDVEMLNKEKDSLCKEFEMVDLGEIHLFLVCQSREIEQTKCYSLIRRNI